MVVGGDRERGAGVEPSHFLVELRDLLLEPGESPGYVVWLRLAHVGPSISSMADSASCALAWTWARRSSSDSFRSEGRVGSAGASAARDSASLRRSSSAGSSVGNAGGGVRSRRAASRRASAAMPTSPAVQPMSLRTLPSYPGPLLPFRGFLPCRATPLPGAAPPGGADSDRGKERGNA